MPEGVEILLSAESIRPLVVGKRIVHAQVGNKSRYKNNPPDNYHNFLAALEEGCCVSSVNVHGKFMYWELNNEWFLLITFGMSGQWGPSIGKHPCFIFQFDDNSQIVFNDPRHFGTIKFTHNKKELETKLKGLGWDPLATPFEDCKDFIAQQLKNSRKCIGELLMNQKTFSGVGNYIRSEALYQAKISPWRQACSLTEKDLIYLCEAIVNVMKASYQQQGATILTFAGVHGEKGNYSNQFKVYGQKQDPLGHPIKKENTLDGRAIHWCPAAQQ